MGRMGRMGRMGAFLYFDTSIKAKYKHTQLHSTYFSPYAMWMDLLIQYPVYNGTAYPDECVTQTIYDILCIDALY